MKRKYKIILFLIVPLILILMYHKIIINFLNILYINNNEIVLDVIFSLKRIIIWYILASFIWIMIWFLTAHFKRFFLIKYLLEILRPIPPIAWIPLAILRFWLWDSSSYFIVFIWSFFPIFTNTYFGVSSIPEIYKETSKNFELSKIDYYYNILFKYSLPYIFSWLKIWLWMWWMSLIAAELIWAQSWLWYYIQINRLLLNTENIILWMFLIGLIWFWLSYLLNISEKILVKQWK